VSDKSKPIQLLVVDDHPLLREGIAAIINNQTDIELVAEASNGREAIEKFRSHRPAGRSQGPVHPGRGLSEYLEGIISP
jgi:CheY-like chemotaxis protein